MAEDKYLQTLKKLAFGFEYEELQTQLEETAHGQKKKIIRTKKYSPPNYQALKEMMRLEKKSKKSEMQELEEEMNNFETGIFDENRNEEN